MTVARGSVVALVSSAGGLEATVRVLAALPGDLAATVLVLQHSDPHRESLLPEILGRHTSLPVTAAVDGQPLQPGTVLVAPTGCQTLITPNGAVSLIPSGPFPPSRPSADLLLTTLAMAYGPAAVAVILSGGGHDGATGAAAIHHHGGTVLATNERSSKHYGMPGAAIARDSIVDAALDLDDVADMLTTLLQAPLRARLEAGPPSGEPIPS